MVDPLRWELDEAARPQSRRPFAQLANERQNRAAHRVALLGVVDYGLLVRLASILILPQPLRGGRVQRFLRYGTVDTAAKALKLSSATRAG
ncbi:hypothetical protein SAMN05216420_101306 [Nitrosospira sp. Nl5]|nr:hypothetical protein SAMN05216420_101306 [Nitrosospira sp. Nl5]